MSVSPLECAAALKHLPHGPEFRFITRLTELQPGRSGTGEFTLSGNEEFLRGHFPGEPLMPGVLLVEAAAQLLGVIAQCDPAIAPLDDLKLTAIRGAKILGTVRPGETLRLEAAVTARLGNLVQGRASGQVANAVVLQVELALSGRAA